MNVVLSIFFWATILCILCGLIASIIGSFLVYIIEKVFKDQETRKNVALVVAVAMVVCAIAVMVVAL